MENVKEKNDLKEKFNTPSGREVNDGNITYTSGARELRKNITNEQGISECYMEGVLKHSGSIGGFIYVVTQLVKNSEGDGTLILADVDEALARLLGELSTTRRRNETDKKWIATPGGQSPHYPIRGTKASEEDITGARNTRTGEPPVVIKSGRGSETLITPPIEEVIAQAAESLADPNFFIAEISGILSALVELKSVAETLRSR